MSSKLTSYPNERSQVVEVAQIQALWKAYAHHVNENEVDAWLELWLDDGVQMPPNEPQHIGKAAIRRANEENFQFYREMDIQPEVIRILGEQAYTHGTYSLRISPRGSGEPEEFRGKFLTILEKQRDGSWKIAVDCFNSSLPAG